MSDRQLARVRALLAKAESTTPEEAELLTAKAEELIIRHALDAGLLDPGAVPPAIIVRRWTWSGELAIGRRRLVMAAVAAIPGAYALYNASRMGQCVRVWAEQEATLDLVDSLLIQADTALAFWWADQFKDSVFGRPGTRKASFLWGFGVGVARRFVDRTSAMVGSGAGLVLADASRRVREHVEAGIKVTAGRPSAASDYVGFSDGIEAGEDADTGGRALARA